MVRHTPARARRRDPSVFLLCWVKWKRKEAGPQAGLPRGALPAGAPPLMRRRCKAKFVIQNRHFRTLTYWRFAHRLSANHQTDVSTNPDLLSPRPRSKSNGKQIRIQFLRAIRTDPVPESGLRVILNVFFHWMPLALIVPDFPAGRTDGQEAFRLPDPLPPFAALSGISRLTPMQKNTGAKPREATYIGNKGSMSFAQKARL